MPAWSKGLIGAVANAGFMGGYPDGSFKPSNNITRAEAVVTLNNALEAVEQVVLDEAGTYGDAETTQIIEGVLITAPDVVLINTVVKGNLTIGEGVGEGEVTLDNVTVEGETFVYGGGENSIYFIDTILVKVTVKKDNGKVRLVAQGTTSVEYVLLESGAKIEEDLDSGSDGFGDVEVGGDISEDDEVRFIGDFEEIKVTAAAKVVIESGSVESFSVEEIVSETAKVVISILKATIESMTINAEDTEVTCGEGAKVTTVEVKAKVKLVVNKGATIVKVKVEATAKGTEISGNGNIESIEVDAEDVTVGGKEVKPGEEVSYEGGSTTTPGSGGGGGSGGSSGSTTPIKVSSITIEVAEADKNKVTIGQYGGEPVVNFKAKSNTHK